MRPTIRMSIIGLQVFAACALSSVNAYAAPILFSIARASAQNQETDPFLIDSEESGVLIGADTAGPVSASVFMASSSAYVTDGVSGAAATASSANVSGSFGNGATGSTQFTDTLTLTSDTLAVGTLVNLAFAIDLHSVISEAVFTSGILIACGTANAQLFVSSLTDSEQLGSLESHHTSCEPDRNNAAGVFSAAIGEELRVDVTLVASAWARAGGSASADASNTLRFYVDPLGAFTYSSASGNTYFSDQQPEPLPEPTAMLLFGMGAIGLLTRRIKSQRRG